jgi:sigma-B regulation protein RsbU (phosphoserine phosphatase)
MIEELDAALRRLLDGCAADAAVVWAARPNEPEGTVVRACPAGVLPPDVRWPSNGHDPAAVPAALSARLPAKPTAARTLALSDTLRLLVAWCVSAPPAGCPDERLVGEIGWLAQLVADKHSEHDEMSRQAVLLDGLDVGLVSVDTAYDFAYVNDTAARLLAVSPGSTTATEFGAALGELAERAVNTVEVRSDTRGLQTDPTAELKTTWEFPDSPTHIGVLSKPAPYPWFEGRIWAFYDNSMLADAMAAANRANALIRTSADAILDPQVLVEAIRADGRVVDLVYRDVNRATCEYLGMSRGELIGHSLLETLPNLDGSGLREIYIRCAETGEPVVRDGFPYQNELLDDLRYYDIRAAQVSPDFISLTWRDVTERSELTRRIATSEQRFRLLAENMADVVVRLRSGRISWISNSVEGALGAPPGHWIGQRLSDFVLPEERAEYARRAVEVGRGEASIGRARLLGADGLPRWIHLHVKPFHEADGTPNGAVASFRVIDDEVAAEERAREQIALRDAQNRSLTRRLQAKTDHLMSELRSAARYVASILPGDLDGRVRVSSRYVPSQELAGDSYDYRWIDDDHLIVYLIDVSGHGVEPAMVSVSVHNMLRSGTLDHGTLLDPDRTLSELNRLFQMDDHGGNYFTIWYGVYQASTRTLRYAGAGHPPALVLAPDGSPVTQLVSDAIPVGIQTEADFQTRSYAVPAGADILIYSDGAFELTMVDGRQWSLGEFAELHTRTAGAVEWTLDALLDGLKDRSESGHFDDDCTLVRLNFP